MLETESLDMRGCSPQSSFLSTALDKDWEISKLAERWNLSKSQLLQLADNPARPSHWNDAVQGLPGANEKADRRLCFRAEANRKGWTLRDLGKRWSMSEGWIGQISRNENRPAQWDDALRALPVIATKTSRIQPEQFRQLVRLGGWSTRTLARRWRIRESSFEKVMDDAQRASIWDDALRGLPPIESVEHERIESAGTEIRQ